MRRRDDDGDTGSPSDEEPGQPAEYYTHLGDGDNAIWQTASGYHYGITNHRPGNCTIDGGGGYDVAYYYGSCFVVGPMDANGGVMVTNTLTRQHDYLLNFEKISVFPDSEMS